MHILPHDGSLESSPQLTGTVISCAYHVDCRRNTANACVVWKSDRVSTLRQRGDARRDSPAAGAASTDLLFEVGSETGAFCFFTVVCGETAWRVLELLRI